MSPEAIIAAVAIAFMVGLGLGILIAPREDDDLIAALQDHYNRPRCSLCGSPNKIHGCPPRPAILIAFQKQDRP